VETTQQVIISLVRHTALTDTQGINVHITNLKFKKKFNYWSTDAAYN